MFSLASSYSSDVSLWTWHIWLFLYSQCKYENFQTPKWDGEYQWTIFRSCQRFPYGFTSGLWLCHSKTKASFISPSHSFAVFALCFVSLSLDKSSPGTHTDFWLTETRSSQNNLLEFGSSRWKTTWKNHATTTIHDSRNDDTWAALSIILCF